jgi:hypothetical protein
MTRKSRKGDASRDASGVQDAGAAEKAEAAREAVSWILGRLDVLEYLVLFLAMVMALLGGALVAWILAPVVPLSFRWTWALASVLAFILPGGFVYLREFRARGTSPSSDRESKPKEPHG